MRKIRKGVENQDYTREASLRCERRYQRFVRIKLVRLLLARPFGLLEDLLNGLAAERHQVLRGLKLKGGLHKASSLDIGAAMVTPTQKISFGSIEPRGVC